MLKGIPILFEKLVKDHENEDDPQAFLELVEKYIDDMKNLLTNEDDSFLSDPKTKRLLDDGGNQVGYKIFLQRDWILTPETYLFCPYCREPLAMLSSIVTHWTNAPYTGEKVMHFECECGKKTEVKVLI